MIIVMTIKVMVVGEIMQPILVLISMAMGGTTGAGGALDGTILGYGTAASVGAATIADGDGTIHGGLTVGTTGPMAAGVVALDGAGTTGVGAAVLALAGAAAGTTGVGAHLTAIITMATEVLAETTDTEIGMPLTILDAEIMPPIEIRMPYEVDLM